MTDRMIRNRHRTVRNQSMLSRSDGGNCTTRGRHGPSISDLLWIRTEALSMSACPRALVPSFQHPRSVARGSAAIATCGRRGGRLNPAPNLGVAPIPEKRGRRHDSWAIGLLGREGQPPGRTSVTPIRRFTSGDEYVDFVVNGGSFEQPTPTSRGRVAVGRLSSQSPWTYEGRQSYLLGSSSSSPDAGWPGSR